MKYEIYIAQNRVEFTSKADATVLNTFGMFCWNDFLRAGLLFVWDAAPVGGERAQETPGSLD